MTIDSNQDKIIRNPYQDKDIKEYINDGGTNRLVRQFHGTEGCESLPRQSYAYVFLTAIQQITTGTDTQAQLASELQDNLGEFASYKFTPKTAGWYFAIGKCLWETVTAGSVYYLHVCKNGSIQTPWRGNKQGGSSDLYPTQVVSALYYLNGTTDYIDMWVWHNKGSNERLYNAYTNLAIWKVA